MSFSAKISISISVLLALIVFLGGFFLVRQNFRDSLETGIEANIDQHIFERYALEKEMLNIYTKKQNINGERLYYYGKNISEYLGERHKFISIYNSGTEVYTDFPADIDAETRKAAANSESGTYRLVNSGSSSYMLVSSVLESNDYEIFLLSGYDMSYVFSQRKAQMRNVWVYGTVVLLFAIFMVVAMANILTRPIRRLNRVSKKITEGGYRIRTGIRTNDEIGVLAKNFDAMAEAIEGHIEQLNISIKQKEEFVSAFSHEIKTPMTSIIGYADFVRSAEADIKLRHNAANHIYHEGKRLEALSQKLLSLMSISEKEITLQPVKVTSITRMLRRSVMPLKEGCSLEIDESSAVVYADIDLLVDLLRNLVLNGFNAEPKDSKVLVRIREGEGSCVFAVCDRGRGLEEDELAHITEAFYMVDKSRSRKEGGTGIGLALCKKIAEAHGTVLGFISKAGEGTVVNFALKTVAEEV